MKQKTRNIAALVLFFFLFALGGCLIALYVFLGHSWNFAATEIDDVSGNMDEYLVVLYEGTAQPAQTTTVLSEQPAESTEETAANAENASSDAQNVSTGSAENASSDAQNALATNAENASSDTQNESSNARTGVRERIMQFFHIGTANQASDEEAEELAGSEVYSEDVPQGLTLGDAYAAYGAKDAKTLYLYTKNPDHYEDGTVFIKGNYKIGVIGLTHPIHYLELQAKIDSLYGRGATMVIAIVSRASLLAATHGVDIAIVTDGEREAMHAYGSGETLYVESSESGTIDAVILSPNHTVTAKTL